MNTNKMKLFLGVAAIMFFLPSLSQAYFATNQTATRLTSDAVLYTASFQLGFLGRELYVPIMSTRGSLPDSDLPTANYDIVNANGTLSTVGVTHSVILTQDEDAEIRNGQYYLPNRKSAEFTLVVLLSVPEDQQSGELSLQVTSLPFTLIKDGVTIPSQLDETELEDYRTPAIYFGEGIVVSSPTK